MIRRGGQSTAPRRGFTLIEMALAMLIGSMVAVATLSMFGVMDRTDRTLSTRFDRRVELNRTQRALQSTFSSLVMPTTRPDDEDPTPVSPRLNLTTDAAQFNRTQRFEVVIARPPLPGLAVRRRTAMGSELQGPIRGVWEVITEPMLDARGFSTGSVGYALRWRTLSVAGISVSPPPGVTPGGDADDTSYVMVRGLRSIQWRVFDDRERKLTYTASTVAELPAYVELHIETQTGEHCEWLFEVDWTLSEEEPQIATSVAARIEEIEATGGAPAAIAEGAIAGIDTDGDGEVDAFTNPDGGVSDTPLAELPERFRRPQGRTVTARGAPAEQQDPARYDPDRDVRDE